MAEHSRDNGQEEIGAAEGDAERTSRELPEAQREALEAELAEPAEPEQENDGVAGEDEDELGRLREAMLRLRADTENQRRRMERELEKSRRFATESLMRDLLQVIDSLDQGLQTGRSSDGDQVREGMELTHRLMLRVLGQHGLEIIEPRATPFDPELHEAMAAEPSAEHPPDTVLQVLQKGYRLNERLLRPARVVVARAPDQA